MRKSILIGVLAALMLFAFTACDNSTPEAPIYGNATVVGASLASAPVYLEGDTFDASDITVSVLLNVGEPIVYTGDEVSAKRTGDKPLEAGANSVTVTVPGATAPYNVTVYAYKPEAYTVNLASTQNTISLAKPELSLDGITVNTTYDGGKTVTRDLEDMPGLSAVTGELVANTLVSGKKVNDIIDVAAILKEAVKDVDTITINGSWSLTVTEESNPVTNVSIALSDKSEYFTVGTTYSTLKDDANLDFTVTLTFKDGTTKSLTKAQLASGTEGYKYKILNLGTNGIKFQEANASTGAKAVNSFTLQIAIVDAADESKQVGNTASLLVSTIDDYPTTITVDTKKKEGTSDQAKEYTTNSRFESVDFTFTATAWASENDSYTAEEKNLAYTLFSSDDVVKDGYSDGATMTVTFEYKGEVGTKTVQPIKCDGVKITIK